MPTYKEQKGFSFYHSPLGGLGEMMRVCFKLLIGLLILNISFANTATTTNSSNTEIKQKEKKEIKEMVKPFRCHF